MLKAGEAKVDVPTVDTCVAPGYNTILAYTVMTNVTIGSRRISFRRRVRHPWSSGSVLDHMSVPPVFESRLAHIWRLFRLSLRLIAYLVHKSGRQTSIIIIITFRGRSAHLSYHVHKSGCKTSIIIILYIVYCKSVNYIDV